jgi:hypothetical protein
MKPRVKYLYNLIEQYGRHKGHIWRSEKLTYLQAIERNKQIAVVQWELSPADRDLYLNEQGTPDTF